MREEERRKAWEDYMRSPEHAEMLEFEEKMFAEHWVNDLLDAPHALIAMVETKIARAALGREREIIKIIENMAYFDENGDEMISEYKNEIISRITTNFGEEDGKLDKINETEEK